MDMVNTTELGELLFGTGKPDISYAGLAHFSSRTSVLIDQVWAASRDNLEDRQQPKQEFIVLMRENMWIPTIACIVYAVIVHGGPILMKNHRGFSELRPVLVAWNLLLAVFSTVGSYHCMTGLLINMYEKNFRYTVCTLPKTIDLYGTDLDVWACFFVLSKIAEFIDTVLKVLMKKDFIFLHWYHHLATAYFCWLSIAYDFAPGMWIAALNFTVHSPMYTYYFLSAVLNKKWFYLICKPLAPFITTMQISQMAIFCVVNIHATYSRWFDGSDLPCSVTAFNIWTNAFLVFTYLVLFSILFVKKYLTKKSAKGDAKPKGSAGKGGRSSSPASKSKRS